MTVGMAALRTNPRLRLARWARRSGLGRKFAFGLTVAAAASGVATYAAMTGATPFGQDPNTVLVLLYIDLALLLLLGAVVARRIVQLWSERRRGSAGSRLHVRLVMLFSLVAVTPAIVVAVFSVLFLNFGVQAWFSDRVSTALGASLAVSKAYLDEHRQKHSRRRPSHGPGSRPGKLDLAARSEPAQPVPVGPDGGPVVARGPGVRFEWPGPRSLRPQLRARVRPHARLGRGTGAGRRRGHYDQRAGRPGACAGSHRPRARGLPLCRPLRRGRAC